MLKKITSIALFAILANTIYLHGQTCQDASVELTVEVQSFPPRITLHWRANVAANQHFIYRKLKASASWGTVVASLPGDAVTYVDTTVMTGISYEYRVLRSAPGYSGYGYINSGIEIPEVEFRGHMILVLDSTVVESLRPEIDRLERDLEGDGWMVAEIIVPGEMGVTEVKDLIKPLYIANPGEPKCLFILGHVPVPYSGELNPDGHPDHLGAWPADAYYADMNGSWTDVLVNNTVASDPRNQNVIGDGKFDQTTIPSDIDMPVGRVDFANMPAFTQSEIQLLRNYLDKDHAYRHKMISPKHRLLVDDNFGYFGGEAFAANAWKNTPLVGMDSVVAGDYFTTTVDGGFLWSYGCGGGSYTSAGGIGTTNDFADADLHHVFTCLFGSYFGDWDSQNNFLRAALAQGWTLTNVWAGRPHWAFHHMGLGETIGYSARVSQNNNTLYFTNFAARGVHMALMGDPSLRNDMIAPVSDVIATAMGTGADVTWNASPDDVMGYYVYVKSEANQRYVRLNDLPITGTSFTDACKEPGVYMYMVRAISLQHTPSGTYYNLSQGITDSVMMSIDVDVHADATWTSFAGIVYFENQSYNASTYQWDFGDGSTSTEENPMHNFGNGDFTVTLIAQNACNADTIMFDISVSTGIHDLRIDHSIRISPNPSAGQFYIDTDTDCDGELYVYDMHGNRVCSSTHFQTPGTLDLSSLTPGIYCIVVSGEECCLAQRVIVQRP